MKCEHPREALVFVGCDTCGGISFEQLENGHRCVDCGRHYPDPLKPNGPRIPRSFIQEQQ